MRPLVDGKGAVALAWGANIVGFIIRELAGQHCCPLLLQYLAIHHHLYMAFRLGLHRANSNAIHLSARQEFL